MSLITLGLAGAVGYDSSAALFVDGELVAAAEEERFLRNKHAKNALPYYAARECMQIARINPTDVDYVALSYAPVSIFSEARWHYAFRHWYAPDRSLDSIFNGNRRYRRHAKAIGELLDKLHIPLAKIKLVPVQHLLSHAGSGYLLSGIKEKTAILSIDSKNEYAATLLAYGHEGKITKIKEFYNPDSLSGMYAALTDYLGFDIIDGELKVMGISPFGDPNKYDLSSLVKFNGKNFKVNNKLISTVGLRRFKAKSKGHFFSPQLVELLGPRREGNLVDDPYIHYAASIQKMFEDITVGLVLHYLSKILENNSRLVVTGTGAMNIRLNQRLLALPQVDELIVHPGCTDAGTAIGAAAFVSSANKQQLVPLNNMYLGPGYSTKQCIEACKSHREKSNWETLDNAPDKAAELLQQGELVAWFQGRMEFGARALGNRSILANPAQAGIANTLNSQVKFRERWRPFSPSILDSCAEELLEESPCDEYMFICVPVKEKWHKIYPSLIYKDGTTRAQVVTEKSNPKFHKLLRCFQQLSGHGLVINTALSRPGEAMVCTPKDAIDVFHGTDLKYLIMEDILVTKREEPADW